MSAELYPHLYQWYQEKYRPKLKEGYDDRKNIDNIVTVLREHFGGLFDLNVINDQLGQQRAGARTKGSYLQLFELCLKQLIDLDKNPETILYDESEMISALHRFFHNRPRQGDDWLLRYTIVPKIEEARQKQIGFLEKLATGQMRYAEPLSFLDMQRITAGMKKLYDHSSGRVWDKNLAVVHLKHLEHLDALAIADLKAKDALIVNFNLDTTGVPQWGIVDLRLGSQRVYCEMPIVDSSKALLEGQLALDLEEENYLGATADSLQTTGYTAATWLDSNVVKAWQCDTNGDFANLLFDTTLLMVAGDSDPLTYRHLPEEEALYFSEAFKHFMTLDTREYSFGDRAKFAHALLAAVQASALAKHEEHAFLPGNLVKILEALHTEQTQGAELEDIRRQATRTFIIGFASTLEAMSFLRQEQDATTNERKTTLTVPHSVDINILRSTHNTSTSKQKVNPYWLNRLLGGANEQQNVSTFMVYTLLRVKAKNPVLDISIHQPILSGDIETMVRLLDANPFVTRIINQTNNASLQQIIERAEPTLARNRWLHASGYLPPIADDYWKRAAHYWLRHLKDVKEDLLQPKAEHELFKGCVREMGQQGLEAVLKLLSDETYQETLGNIYGLDKPAFYLGCAQSGAYQDYLQTFLTHLQTKQYFPFSEVGVAYHRDVGSNVFIDVLRELNKRGSFEKVTLTDCLSHPAAFSNFMERLITVAHVEGWQAPIVIPELSGDEANSEANRRLRNRYAVLNDIILTNRRLNKSQAELRKINDSAHFVDAGAMPSVEPGEDGDGVDEDELEDASEVMHKLYALDAEDDTWSFQKGGDVQLQLQQQLNINQSRQIQQEQQRVVHQLAEAALNGQLVDYNNIDHVLGAFWEQFKAEHPYNLHAARLRHNETELKGFFHTFINANPHVANAAHVIQKMTPEAAKMLLRHHEHLSSGLNPDNLPKGFFTQRNKDGQLVLLYDPEVAYLALPNAFTLDFSVHPLQAEPWKGSFRQFSLERYFSAAEPSVDVVWDDILLFAKLQPAKTDYTAEYNAFLATRGADWHIVLPATKNKILNNWPVFYQCWKYGGDAGIDAFLAKYDAELQLPPERMAEVLFQRQLPELFEWAEDADFDEHELKAMGQIYYKFGDAGLTTALRKLKELEDELGEDFFAAFRQHILARTGNFNVLMSEKCMHALDDMIVKLKPEQARGKKQAFVRVMELHMRSVDWEPIEKLWNGFELFSNEVGRVTGLSLEGREFDDIGPENMLVCMDRIASSLEHLSEGAQAHFLHNLHELDLTHGGVHYALQKEGFQNFHNDLWLYEFRAGKPTYAADLKRLYTPEFDLLQMKRALAACSKFKPEAFAALLPHFATCDGPSKDLLMWVLNTRFSVEGDIDVRLNQIKAVAANVKHVIARHLQEAVYERGQKHLAVSLSAVFTALPHLGTYTQINALLQKHPNGTVLEALTLLEQTKRLDAESVTKLKVLFDADLAKPDNCSEVLSCQAYKLSALLNAIENTDLMEQFYAKMRDLKPVVKQELNLLMTQLLSTDCETSDLDALTPERFQRVLQCMDEMQAAPAKTSELRVAVLDEFGLLGLNFKYSKSGAYRAVTDEDKSEADLKVFTDHKTRLWNFIKAHIVVPSARDDAKAEIRPILQFLKTLQLNRTYLNEVEPLLAILEKTPAEKYWTARYFSGLLYALQPKSDEVSFPISLLKVVLEERAIIARDIDEVSEVFPADLVGPFQAILEATDFDRDQQALLCRIALKEFDERGVVSLLNQVMSLLAKAEYQDSRGYALEMLAKSPNLEKLEQQLTNCRWLLQHPATPELKADANWTQVGALWLKALSGERNEQALFDTIKGQFEDDVERQALILHIIAYASLREGLHDTDMHAYELQKKAPKLVQTLGKMSLEELEALAKCYPQQPSPGTDDIRRLVKAKEQSHADWQALLNDFLSEPYPEPRADYAGISITRDADLQRMIAETRVSAREQKQPFSATTSANLTLVFMYLKSLEHGDLVVKGANKPVKAMSQAELADAYKSLSAALQDPENQKDMLLRAQLWAVLFETLGRTTKKYPHLAQQFALIANDIGVDAPTRVLQLATGEGKSHFVAMRAARRAGQGKKVNICTAKRTLASRDLEDYQDFLSYLGLKTADVGKLLSLSRENPEEARELYQDAEVTYSTLGDLSLFMDGQTYAGCAVEHNPEESVGLLDEFDFIRFEEGRKTEYNYARPTGKTPKQMTWFYQAVNRFYQEQQFAGVRNAHGEVEVRRTEIINKQILIDFYRFLEKQAEGHEERERMLPELIKSPIQLVQWLQSAREAAELERGSGFTVREINIKVGDELYPMQEVIPVSSDNQPMTDSTFSAGVHQLLAVRLNSEAEAKGLPQNFHIHPESNIISSQVASRLLKTLWTVWEGFSGTITAAQAKSLHEDHRTAVLHVPTNQRDLRCWHKPEFFDTKPARDARMVQQIRDCLAKKQSMLFACKDDKHVEALNEVLKRHLTPEELEQFIFFTNEQNRTASEVLQEKRTKETWTGGKKQKGIGLVASGFGRGDNVEVEAVFLFGFNDNSDKLQKGGRTARNGAEGEVFQFFLNEELHDEKDKLMTWLEGNQEDDDEERDDHACDDFYDDGADTSSHQSVESVKENLAKVVSDTEEEKCLEQVMLLREYRFGLHNAANQGYREVVAEFSGWGMSCLGKIKDPAKRKEFTTLYSAYLKELQRAWTTLASDADFSADEKIQAARQCITNGEGTGVADKFFLDLRNDLQGEHAIEVEPFVFLAEHKEVKVELVTPRPACKPTAEERAASVICGAMARLSGNMAHPALANVPEMIHELELIHHRKKLALVGRPVLWRGLPQRKDREAQIQRIWSTPNKKLLQLAEEVAECKTFDDFSRALSRCLRQARSPSPHEDVIEGATQAIEPNELLDRVGDVALRVKYRDLMRQLEPEVQTEITEALCAPLVEGEHSSEERIQNAMPLLEYLVQFDRVQQERWGAGYVRELLGFSLEAEHKAALALHLKGVGQDVPIPMAYNHFYALWQLAKTVPGDVPFEEAFVVLGKAVKNNPENRVRMLSKWESWAKDLPVAERQAFLLSFCNTMSQFEEGRDWDVFVGLVNKTQAWWNKFGEKKYRAELISLWKKLEASGDALETLTAFMNLGVKPPACGHAELTEKDRLVGVFGGKSWFQALGLGFDKLNVTHLARHGMQLGKLWLALDINGRKKSDQTTLFATCCEGLSQVHDLIAKMDIQAMQAECNQWLSSLDGARFESLTLFVHEQYAFLEDNLLVLHFALNYLANPDVAISRAERVRDVFIDWVKDDALQDSNYVRLILTLDSVNPQLFKNLSDIAFEKVMALTEAHKHLFAQFPELHAKMFEYSLDNTITPERFDVLAELLLEAGRFHRLHPEISTAHLIAGVERFRDKSEQVLVAVRDLFADKISEQPLFDSAAEYLADDRETGRAEILDVMKLFYKQRAAMRTETIGLLQQADVYPLFAFDADESKETRDKRVIWMHLLDQGVFTEETTVGNAEVSHRWSAGRNDILLDASYGRYTARTNALLKEAPQKAQLGKVRGLTTAQQKHLLKLTDEMQVIGERLARPLRSVSEVDAQVASLKASLSQASSKYRNSWFKSAERTMQFDALNKKIEAHFSDLSGHEQRASAAYELILEEIRKARLDAMKSDIEVNKNRFFKMNSSGRSRYFNTLNQMQDTVLSEWTQDLDAMQRFHIYKQHHAQEFQAVYGYLVIALDEHVKALGRMSSSDPSYDNWFYRLGRFFGFFTDEAAVDALDKAVQAFNIAAANPFESADAVGALYREVKVLEPRLPGYLKTLANEVLARGDALEANLRSQVDYVDIRCALGA